MFYRHLQLWTKCLRRRIPKITSPNQCQSRTSGADKTFGRTKSVPYAGTAYDVFQRAYGKVQFSPTADGRYESVHITKSTKRSVKKALEDGIDYSEGALYFVEKTMANPKNVSWFDEALTRLFTYQGHSFYK